MGLSYHDAAPSPLPGRAALQFASTVRAPLSAVEPGPRTQPQVHESWPMGLEAAQPCRGWCDRQGRGCDRGQCRFEAGAVLTDDQLEEAFRLHKRAHPEEDYASKPLPLSAQAPTPQMIGAASANALACVVGVGLLVWGAYESYPAVVRFAEKWMPVVARLAVGWV